MQKASRTFSPREAIVFIKPLLAVDALFRRHWCKHLLGLPGSYDGLEISAGEVDTSFWAPKSGFYKSYLNNPLNTVWESLLSIFD
jgi:hypothetical protein